MNLSSLLVSLLLSAGAPPEITELYPTPLALGSTVDITGEHFEPDMTSVAIISDLDPLATPLSQSIIYVLETNVRFTVSKSTPIGSATLRVTTSEGSDDIKVEVVPAPPVLGSVSPNPIVLGELATIEGSDLESVESVTLGDMPCEISAQNVSLIVCQTPNSAELIGQDVTLSVSGPFGEDTLSVSTIAPQPVIESLAPNPVRQGDLLTITGNILPYLLEVSVGGQEALIVEATDGQVVVAVPTSTQAGAAEVVVHIDTQMSAPAGPLWVEPADPDKPRVDAVYPSVVVQGGVAWAVGDKLDEIDAWSEEVEVDQCDKKACRLSISEDFLGPLVLNLSSPQGTSVFALQVVEDEGQAAPLISTTEPNPAFIGESLSLIGEGLFEVSHVLIGGVVQSIDYLGADEIRVTLSEFTPRGAERAFVASSSASDAITITVLDPFPSQEEADSALEPEDTGLTPEEGDAGPTPDPEAERQSDAGESQGEGEAQGDDGARATDTPRAEDADSTIETPAESPGGCAGSKMGDPRFWLLMLPLGLLLVTRRRRLV